MEKAAPSSALTSTEAPRLRVTRLDYPANVYFFGQDEEGVAERVVAGQHGERIQGRFGIVRETTDHVYLIRDRLGLGKLFYHLDHDRAELTTGHYLYDVAAATRDYNAVRSVPAGHYLKLDRRTLRGELRCYWDTARIPPRDEFDPASFTREVHDRLEGLFTDLADRFEGRRFVVCLSGGLDSSVVASYAKRHLRDVLAASFSFEELSDDFRAAESIAGHLGLDFLPIVVPRHDVEPTLEGVLRYGQDWRDFNVHCAWVNDQIGRSLHDTLEADQTIVLTGDLMNEFVADYTEVEFGGVSYYKVPKIPREKFRRFLVHGLDAGDREVGVFHRWGFTVVQPYGILAEEYLAVPPELVRDEGIKEDLNSGLIADPAVRERVVKAKVRAQVGGRDGGTLGLFHEQGISQEDLTRRWNAMYEPMAGGELEPIIHAGRYRS